ncbi:MAG: V4R domain-containing protein [Candidatus Caldarchaeum sp.]
MSTSEPEIHDSVLGGRVFMLSAKTFNEMISLLGEAMSRPVADVLMWNIGHRYGVALGRKTRMMSKSPNEAIKTLVVSAFKSGWGVPEVADNIATSGSLEVVVTNCVFCDGSVRRDSPNCYFLSGILNGIAESLYDVKFETVEKECRVMGFKACRFNITRI